MWRGGNLLYFSQNFIWYLGSFINGFKTRTIRDADASFCMSPCMSTCVHTFPKVQNQFLLLCLFFRKFNHDFLQCFKVHLVVMKVHLKAQSINESTEYIQKYINALSDVLCTLSSFPIEKYWFLHVNVLLGVLFTFKSVSTKHIRRYKVHPKVQSTPHMHVSIYFSELGLNQKGKFI